MPATLSRATIVAWRSARFAAGVHQTDHVDAIGVHIEWCTLCGYGAHACVVRRGMRFATAATCCRRGRRGGGSRYRRPLRIVALCASASFCVEIFRDVSGRGVHRSCRAATSRRRLAGLQVGQGVGDRCVTKIGDDCSHCPWRRCRGDHRHGFAGPARGARRAGPTRCTGYRPHWSGSLDQALSSSSLTGQHQAVALCHHGR